MPNNKAFNFLKMFYDIRQVCLTEDVCGTCAGAHCLVGYARLMIAKAKQLDTDTIDGGFKNIPIVDLKGGYDKNFTMDAIAHTLQQCKSCKDHHTEDCLVNIIRNCYEVIAFGEERDYPGSTLMYFAALQNELPDEADYITKKYQAKKHPLEDEVR